MKQGDNKMKRNEVCMNCGHEVQTWVGTPTDLAKAIREEAENQIIGDLYEDDIATDYHLKITLTVLEVRNLFEKLSAIGNL